ncbi:DNA methyltransferase [Aliarcobacter butzleri]|uniref:DNA methyltransferase n=1 Tax=Aliarcobacter butzleri TaxID=28197 RepID=UPI002B24C73D|nr:DNA methyltransferase [Aliarcobacter butzleri]
MCRIENIDALERIKELPDNSQDIIFGDFPYALGSIVFIDKKDGKPKYKEAKDFQNKWNMPDHNFWEDFFIECYRVLKYGGRVLGFGIDRQLMLFNYYAVAAGLETQQSLYWYYLSNFPKSVDLSKQIDKKLGKDRKIVGTIKRWGGNANGGRANQKNNTYNPTKVGTLKYDNLTLPESELAKKYEGYKYSIAPLKQVLETIMVFQKPLKTNTIIDDFILFSNGDNDISPSIWNIDNNRIVALDDEYRNNFKFNYSINSSNTLNLNFKKSTSVANEDGRYPANLYICNNSAIKIDQQSGLLKSGSMKRGTIRKNIIGNTYNKMATHATLKEIKGDIGGCSKILEKIDYLEEELELLIYNPKVSKKERYFGAENNNHPTLKPIKLIKKIALLLKTPHEQNIFFPFAGVASEIIGFEQAGYNSMKFIATEINTHFCDIGNKRITIYKNNPIDNLLKNKLIRMCDDNKLNLLHFCS